jgi:hypothetical protein
MEEGLLVISGRHFQLINKSFVWRGAFKYKVKNLGVLYLKGKASHA